MAAEVVSCRLDGLQVAAEGQQCFARSDAADFDAGCDFTLLDGEHQAVLATLVAKRNDCEAGLSSTAFEPDRGGLKPAAGMERAVKALGDMLEAIVPRTATGTGNQGDDEPKQAGDEKQGNEEAFHGESQHFPGEDGEQ